jgi:hypothetical protein
MQLAEFIAQDDCGSWGRTETGAGTEQPSKSYGSMSRVMFRQQFKTAVEPRESHTHITALSVPAAHILHGIPTRAMYKRVTEVLENCYSDHHLKAAFHSKLKRRALIGGESLQESAAIIDDLAHCTDNELCKHLMT